MPMPYGAMYPGMYPRGFANVLDIPDLAWSVGELAPGGQPAGTTNARGDDAGAGGVGAGGAAATDSENVGEHASSSGGMATPTARSLVRIAEQRLREADELARAQGGKEADVLPSAVVAVDAPSAADGGGSPVAAAPHVDDQAAHSGAGGNGVDAVPALRDDATGEPSETPQHTGAASVASAVEHTPPAKGPVTAEAAEANAAAAAAQAEAAAEAEAAARAEAEAEAAATQARAEAEAIAAREEQRMLDLRRKLERNQARRAAALQRDLENERAAERGKLRQRANLATTELTDQLKQRADAANQFLLRVQDSIQRLHQLANHVAAQVRRCSSVRCQVCAAQRAHSSLLVLVCAWQRDHVVSVFGTATNAVQADLERDLADLDRHHQRRLQALETQLERQVAEEEAQLQAELAQARTAVATPQQQLVQPSGQP